MRTWTIALLAFSLAGCYKDEADDLTNNPFDADYTGAEIFTLESDFVEQIVQPNGSINRRFTQRVRVHTEHFLIANVTYVVQGASNGVTINTFSNEVVDGSVDLVTNNTQPGTTYCWEVRLTNQGGIGARNTVCSIAD